MRAALTYISFWKLYLLLHAVPIAHRRCAVPIAHRRCAVPQCLSMLLGGDKDLSVFDGVANLKDIDHVLDRHRLIRP
jgi:hypothetical protein